MKQLKSIGDNTQPCRTPVVTSNLSDVSPADLTWHQVSECATLLLGGRSGGCTYIGKHYHPEQKGVYGRPRQV